MTIVEILQVLGIGFGIILFILTLFSTILIWIGAKIARVEKSGFFRALLAAVFSTVIGLLITAILSYVPAVGTVLGLLISLIFVVLVIKGAFDTDFSKALLIWIFHFIAVVFTALAALLIVPAILTLV